VGDEGLWSSIEAGREMIALSPMTGEQTTLILGLAVFGMMVFLLSRAKSKKPAHEQHAKPTAHKSAKKRR
jgi:hypothetical protein